jgi:MFS family permease
MRKAPFLYLSAFLMDGGLALASLCIPLLAIRVGGTYDDLGALRATHSLTYALGAFWLGRLADRIGYQRSMAACCLLLVPVFAGYYYVSAVWQLFGLALLTGIATCAFWPSLQAWLAEGQRSDGLRQRIGSFNMSWSLGMVAGPGLAGALYAAYAGLSFALLAALFFAMFVGVVLLQVREDGREQGHETETASLAAARIFLPVAWIANFSTYFAIGIVRSLFPKLATDLGVQTAHLGYLMALIGLAQLATFALISRTERWQFRLWPLVTVQFAAMLGLGVLAFSTSLIAFAGGLLLLGVMIGFTYTASGFYSLHSTAPGGGRIGIHETILGGGNLVGPLAGGLVGEYIGARAPYMLAAGVIAIALAAQTIYLRRARAS